MIPTFSRETLKAALFAHRKKMGRAARGRQRKPARWLYPWAKINILKKLLDIFSRIGL
jgi:hypothetical protein